MSARAKKLPVTRTIEYLAARGWLADRVDRQITRVLSRDYLGIADVLALHPASGRILAVQCTDNTNATKRQRKLESDDLAAGMAALRQCNIGIEVWGWYPGRDEPRVIDLS